VIDRDLAPLLAAHDLVFVCGPGGVGKTTTSAALALRVALTTDRRVLVVTVDPARRLADALGLRIQGNDPIGVRLPRRSAGRLDAAMLDTRAAWDALVMRHAPDKRVRERLLANPLYTTVTERFGLSHEYIAMERVHELRQAGSYDLIIVDTAPMANAVDVLDAPDRMIEFFGSRLVRWLTVPAGSRLTAAASRPFTTMAERLLGAGFLADIIDFFSLLATMESGFARRASEVKQILHSPATTFVAVTTPEAGPLAQTIVLEGALRRRDLRLGALVVNRVLADDLADEALRLEAESLLAAPDRVLQRAAAGALELHQRAEAHRAAIATIDARHAGLHAPLVATVPLRLGGMADIASLDALGAGMVSRLERPRTRTARADRQD
jgi:anion-transporting  ArsA/GET3 family ATPase